MAQLVQANCCNLHVLDISCCALSFEAVSELSRGRWPLLHSLVACENSLFFWPTDSVKRLLDGRWPFLTKLVPSPSDCEAAAFLLSDRSELLDIEYSNDSNYHIYPLNKVRKTVTGHGLSQWPCLKLSAFVFPFLTGRLCSKGLPHTPTGVDIFFSFFRAMLNTVQTYTPCV